MPSLLENDNNGQIKIFRRASPFACRCLPYALHCTITPQLCVFDASYLEERETINQEQGIAFS